MEKNRNFFFRQSKKDGYFYLLLFHHSIRNLVVFANEDDFLYANDVDKYSLFGYLNNNFKTNEDAFEFILEYPDTGKYGHWTQKINPLNAEANSNVNVSIKEDSTWNLEDRIPFIGLHNSNQPSYSFLEGCNSIGNNGDEFYFSVGMKAISFYNSIPSYSSSVRVWEENLWIKITNPKILRKFRVFSNIKTFKIHKQLKQQICFTFIFILCILCYPFIY